MVPLIPMCYITYGTKKSCAVCRRLGPAGLKPEHEKVVRSFMNSQDMFESLTTGSGKFECQKDFFLLLTEFFLSRILFLGDGNLWGRQSSQCLRTALSCATILLHDIVQIISVRLASFPTKQHSWNSQPGARGVQGIGATALPINLMLPTNQGVWLTAAHHTVHELNSLTKVSIIILRSYKCFIAIFVIRSTE